MNPRRENVLIAEQMRSFLPIGRMTGLDAELSAAIGRKTSNTRRLMNPGSAHTFEFNPNTESEKVFTAIAEGEEDAAATVLDFAEKTTKSL